MQGNLFAQTHQRRGPPRNHRHALRRVRQKNSLGGWRGRGLSQIRYTIVESVRINVVYISLRPCSGEYGPSDDMRFVGYSLYSDILIMSPSRFLNAPRQIARLDAVTWGN